MATDLATKKNGHAAKIPVVTLRNLAQRLTPNPALTVDGTLAMILDGVDRLDTETLARNIARANKGLQIDGDPGPISDELWNASDPMTRLSFINAAKTLKMALVLMCE